MPSSTQWRIFITANNGGSVHGAIAELQMRSSIAGSNLCSGGTASASSTFSTFVASRAFDGNTATEWYANVATSGEWLQYTFASAQSIVEIAITSPSSNQADCPKDFKLQYWDGSAWQDQFTIAGSQGWLVTETRTFPNLLKQAWRINVSASQDGSNTGVAELAMHTSVSGSNVCTGGEPYSDHCYLYLSATTYTPDKAFDGNASTFWVDTAAAAKIQYRFASTQPRIVEYVLQAPPSGNETNAPKTWTLEYSDGSGGWTVVDTRTNVAAWTAGETRTYTVAIPLDSSSFARTLTLTNGADLAGTPVKFGAGSLRCAGTGATSTTGYGITAPTSTDFDRGSGQFTVECWAYFNTAQTDSGFIGRWTPNQFFLFLNAGILTFRFFDGTTFRDTTAAWAPAVGQWYHLAADRDGSNVVRIYVDGVVKASATFAQAWQVVTNTLQIGFVGGVATSGYQMDGYLDEMRFSNTARYGGAFTPSASAFSSDANTLLLVHANDAGNLARVSQAVVEVLRVNTAVKAQVSQAALEVLRTNNAVKAKVSQSVVEVLRVVTTAADPAPTGHVPKPPQSKKDKDAFPLSLRTWSQNLLLTTLGGVGQLPAGAGFAAQDTFIRNDARTRNAYGVDRLTWVQNLLSSTLTPPTNIMYGAPGEVPAYYWPLPLRPIYPMSIAIALSGVNPPPELIITSTGRKSGVSYSVLNWRDEVVNAWGDAYGDREIVYEFASGPERGGGHEFEDTGANSGIYNPEEE